MSDADTALDQSPEEKEMAEFERLSDEMFSEAKTDDSEAGEQVEEAKAASETEATDTLDTQATTEGDEETIRSDKVELDVSWAPTEIKEQLLGLAENGDAAGFEALKNVYKSMQSDATKKWQEVAEEKKRLEAMAEYATIGEAAMTNPQLKAQLAEYLANGEVASTEPEVEPFDVLEKTPEEVSAEIDRRVEAKLEAALNAREAKREAQTRKMTERETAITAAAQEHVKKAGVDGETYMDAVKRLDAFLADTGIPADAVTADNYERFIQPHLDAARANALLASQDRKNEQSKSDDQRAAKASSPMGLASAATERVPAYVAEKRPPTNDELAAETLAEFRAEGWDLSD